jgi:N-acetylmuramoyl-L-alanine amidase
MHYTGEDSAADALRTLSDPRLEVSAHYRISRDRTIYQLVDERLRAWHAGVANWGGDSDINSSSIGIELDNNGNEDFAESEIGALLALLADLQGRYRIPPDHVLGHGAVAPRRKLDAGRQFPWRRLAEAGFGRWCDKPYPSAPPDFDAVLGLRALG